LRPAWATKKDPVSKKKKEKKKTRLLPLPISLSNIPSVYPSALCLPNLRAPEAFLVEY
jgi:hypothetical protein